MTSTEPKGQPWVAIWANPYSGRGPNRHRVRRLVDQLEHKGLGVRVSWAPARRRHLFGDDGSLESCRCLVAAGGDGTIASVIGRRIDLPLAVLPMGNENLFAKQFGYTLDIDSTVRAITDGRSQRIDLAEAGDRRFSVVLSAGFDADVVRRVHDWRVQSAALRRVGWGSYTEPILQSLCHYDYPPIELIADGRRVRGAQVLVFNLPRYGLGFRFLPDACGDDGLLDWIVFQRPGPWSIVHNALAVWRRRHLQCDHVIHGRARRLRLTSPGRAPIEADGEAAGFTPIDIDILPQTLTVLTP